MTIKEAILKVDGLKPSQYDEATKIGWLSDLDGQIWEDVLRHYRDASSAPAAYTVNDMDRVLLVGRPHEDVYITWLSAMIDYTNGEFERYNNTMMMHNAMMQTFYNAVVRNNTKKQESCIEI